MAERLLFILGISHMPYYIAITLFFLFYFVLYKDLKMLEKGMLECL